MPLISTLPKRDRPVTEADFRNVDRLKYIGNDNTAHLLAEWNDRIPLLPSQVASIFDELAPYGVSIEMDTQGADAISICLNLGTSDYDFRFLDFKDREFTNSDMRLSAGLQNRGLGRVISGRMIEFAVAVGFEQHSFQATLEMGAYVWAKAGADLDFAFGAVKEPAKLRCLISQRLKTLEGLIPDDVYAYVTDLLEFEDPKDISKIAKLDMDVGTLVDASQFVEGGVYERSLRSTLLKQVLSVDDKTITKHAVSPAAIIDSCKTRGIPLSLGKFLLAGQSFPGKFDYTNMDQMKGLSDFYGGFRFTDIVPDQLREPVIAAKKGNSVLQPF